MNEYNNYDILLKIIIVGDSGVGKSSLLARFVDDTFNESYIQTLGVDFKLRTIKLNESTVKVQIWDTAGTEKYASLTSSFYRGSHGIIIVYNLVDQNTYQNVSKWIKEVNRSAGIRNKRLLIGNKLDLVDKRVVPTETAKKFAEQHEMQFLETSAKTSENVEEAFFSLVDTIVTLSPHISSHDQTVRLEDYSKQDDQNNYCC